MKGTKDGFKMAHIYNSNPYEAEMSGTKTRCQHGLWPTEHTQ